MGFNKVYKNLLEIFPQIDARALRAVAIEHSKDADAAVDAVLEEIIPFLAQRSRPSSPILNTDLTGSFEGARSSSQSSDVPCMKASASYGYNMNSQTQRSTLDAEDGHNEHFYDTYDGHHEEETKTAEFALPEKTHENRSGLSVDSNSHGTPAPLIDNYGLNSLQVEEKSGDLETLDTISSDKCPESIIKISSDSVSCQTLGLMLDVDRGLNDNLDLNQEMEDLVNQLETDLFMTVNEGCDLEKSCADGHNSMEGTASLTVHIPSPSPLETSGQSVEVLVTQESNVEKSEVSFTADTDAKLETASNICGAEDDSTLMSATMSQSSQVHIIDILEEIIADARNNKSMLFAAMESVIGLMREVEGKEQASELAKQEAAKGGADILLKVEELKAMLQHAKGANDMHAGEVYGEKAILATELRELQSRVLSLSDERDKSLAVLEEMRQTLEMRLAAAENEIKSAQQEKLEKEKTALKLLSDQEKVMENVVRESNILKKQAEENAKLQEFLVDRGRVVDMLQGEIAVICQDVRLLKEKFDDNVPVSKSLSSSQTSCILASSSSSSRSLIEEVEPIPNRDDLLETREDGDDDLVSEAKTDADTVSEVKAANDDRKALLEEGWEFFDDCEIDA